MASASRGGGASPLVLAARTVLWCSAHNRWLALPLLFLIPLALMGAGIGGGGGGGVRGSLSLRRGGGGAAVVGADDLCPSTCADGTPIDTTVCPPISNGGVLEILKHLTPASVSRPLPNSPEPPRPLMGSWFVRSGFPAAAHSPPADPRALSAGCVGLGGRSLCRVFRAVCGDVPHGQLGLRVDVLGFRL